MTIGRMPTRSVVDGCIWGSEILIASEGGALASWEWAWKNDRTKRNRSGSHSKWTSTCGKFGANPSACPPARDGLPLGVWMRARNVLGVVCARMCERPLHTPTSTAKIDAWLIPADPLLNMLRLFLAQWVTWQARDGGGGVVTVMDSTCCRRVFALLVFKQEKFLLPLVTKSAQTFSSPL